MQTLFLSVMAVVTVLFISLIVIAHKRSNLNR
ncbi:MAG: hypothetical protein K0Q66_1449 [Chitinophagaceae bacterium]|jgi:hypothetical protein|nr:hypothetical protein [Chitinophagaceae bacterium]